MMSNRIEWLPDLVLFESHGGDWTRYLNALYALFLNDFVRNKTTINRTIVAIKRHPLIDGKEATFWHLISEGNVEGQRIPDIKRCEKIRWPKPIIENSTDQNIKLWKNKRKGEERICLWLEKEEYLVVLAIRKSYVLLWTAYLVTRDHQKKKLEAEYNEYKKAETAQDS